MTLLDFRPQGIGLYAVVISPPIDDDHTHVLLRYHQEMIDFPAIGKLTAKAAAYFEWEVVQGQQDIPVLQSLRPKHTDVGVNRLVRADEGSATYLKLRRRLIHEAQERRAQASAGRGRVGSSSPLARRARRANRTG